MIINAAFWNQIKSVMKGRNQNNKLLETWLDPVEFVDVAGTPQLPRLQLGVPSHLHKYFVVENLLEKIYAEIAAAYPTSFEVELVVDVDRSRHQEAQCDVEQLLGHQHVDRAIRQDAPHVPWPERRVGDGGAHRGRGRPVHHARIRRDLGGPLLGHVVGPTGRQRVDGPEHVRVRAPRNSPRLRPEPSGPFGQRRRDPLSPYFPARRPAPSP